MCKPKPTSPKPKRTVRPLSPQILTVLEERLEAATLDGRIVLCEEDMGPCDSLDFTLNELALLQQILLPEYYCDPSQGREAPARTGTAPGSADRIAEYAQRVTDHRAVCVPGDATAHGAHDRGLRIEQRKNGSGVRVVGWDELS